jgi:CRP-like cAMP-binding protein
MSSLKDFRLAFENRLLAALPADEYRRLLPHLEPVRLPQGKILYHAGDAIRHAYFLRGGMASLLSVTGDGRIVEVGMIGNEGLVGMPVVLRTNTSPYQSAVQLPANAMRIGGDALRAEFDRGGRLHDLLLRYLHTLLYQISQSATCNRFHTMEERLCRWLLVCRDRTQTDALRLTQEFLSQMIGAPRTRVTTVAVRLQEAGLISYSRGQIVIRDRRRLEALSCECYRIVREQIGQFIAA